MRSKAMVGILGSIVLVFLATGSLAEPARQGRTVGILNYAGAHDVRVVQFLDALREHGHVDGRNLTLVQRHADGDLERLPDLASQLVERRVDVIIALGPATWAARQATRTVPIVTAFSGDPVGQGVVASLDRPGGNITGFSYMSSDLAEKRLELLCAAFAKCSRVAVLYNPREPATAPEMEQTKVAAARLGVTLQPLAVHRSGDLDDAFVLAARDKADGLLSFTHGFAVLNKARIVDLAARHRVPVMYGWREFVDEGGLMSYGPEIRTLVRQAAGYVDRILKGAKPSDLPVQQPTHFQLVLNLKVAKSLDLTLPPAILVRADVVIE